MEGKCGRGGGCGEEGRWDGGVQEGGVEKGGRDNECVE